MSRDLDGKVAVITGAARGQGRSHARRLASMGASIVAIDLCADLPLVAYRQPDKSSLDETVAAIESDGGQALGWVGDVRDPEAMREAVAAGVDRWGGVDIVCANAGIIQLKPAVEVTAEDWALVIGINLTGVWNTVSACLPSLIARGPGGAVVITSSAAGVKGPPNMAHYAASKSGVIGLMRSLAAELGPHGIRVNCVAPTTVDTEMVHWPEAYAMFRPDLDQPTREDVSGVFSALNVLPVPWIEPSDVTEAVAWLVSTEARYVTGVVLPVDAGTLIK